MDDSKLCEIFFLNQWASTRGVFRIEHLINNQGRRIQVFRDVFLIRVSVVVAQDLRKGFSSRFPDVTAVLKSLFIPQAYLIMYRYSLVHQYLNNGGYLYSMEAEHFTFVFV